MPARPVQAYLMLGLGALDLVERSPIGVVFVLFGCYLLYGRTARVVCSPSWGRSAPVARRVMA